MAKSQKFDLFIASVIVVALFLAIPQYNKWFFGFILQPPLSYRTQLENLDPEARKILRYSNSYAIYMQSIGALQQLNIMHPVILLPPFGYLRDNGVVDVDVVEPPEFYYYTGYRGVLPTSPGVEKATWTIVPHKPTVMLRRIHSKEDLDNLINTYKRYKPEEK